MRIKQMTPLITGNMCTRTILMLFFDLLLLKLLIFIFICQVFYFVFIVLLSVVMSN